jgi:hypothetical protein
MTGPQLPPAVASTQPERLTVAMAVLLVAVGNFGSALLAALLIVVCLGLAGCAPSTEMMIGHGGDAEITADRGDAPSSTDRSDRSDRGGRSSASASPAGGSGSADSAGGSDAASDGASSAGAASGAGGEASGGGSADGGAGSQDSGGGGREHSVSHTDGLGVDG